mgnify:FL=1|tara:strand:- start:1493 stop:2074 length:582 start_codon:yes stop_codon:yes gene_type:complete
MNRLIKEYPDWLSYGGVGAIWHQTVVQPNWRFGQKSNNDTIYPMWFQAFYDTFADEWKVDNPDLKELVRAWNELIGDDYKMVRIMLSGNTYGQDGDVHDDWQVPGESLTGVLYLNTKWEDNWGGETVVYDRENPDYLEISKVKAGKLIVFDGSNPHIGKGPQRNCGELRSIIAIQSVKHDAWQKHLDKIKKKS